MRQAVVEPSSLSRSVRGIASPAALFWQRQFDRFVARMRDHAIPLRVKAFGTSVTLDITNAKEHRTFASVTPKPRPAAKEQAS